MITNVMRTRAIQRKRNEADGLIRLAMRLNDITPNVQMATYTPETTVLVDTAIQLQNEAERLEHHASSNR